MPILLLLYVSSLKLLGYVPEATSIYRSMARRRDRIGAYGWIGLADITHTVALWRRLVDEYDARGFTLFPLVDGLTAFLSDSMGWKLAVEATFDEARRCYAAAIDAAPELAFAWHELARLEADSSEPCGGCRSHDGVRPANRSRSRGWVADGREARGRASTGIGRGAGRRCRRCRDAPAMAQRPRSRCLDPVSA